MGVTELTSAVLGHFLEVGSGKVNSGMPALLGKEIQSLMSEKSHRKSAELSN